MSNRINNNQEQSITGGNDSSEEICSICLDQLSPSAELCTPCHHLFHARCLMQSLVYGRMFCPYCRTPLSENWLLMNRLIIRMSREEYWAKFDEEFGRPIGDGPLIPSQQRVMDAALYRRFGVPEIWDSIWIEDKLSEIRMRFNIPPDIVLYTTDIEKIERLGRRGLTPEWNISNWIWS